MDLEFWLVQNHRFSSRNFRLRGYLKVSSRDGPHLLNERILTRAIIRIDLGREYHDLIQKVLDELFFKGTRGEKSM